VGNEDNLPAALQKSVFAIFLINC